MTDSPNGNNRLAKESSPYLLQHADNPVNWYPWGDEAFEKAREEDKPVFLSIGYATCHWCHVMAHESFEDEQIAAMMNEAFVNIKVDREERPDIDNTYMLVCQMMTGQGGWPLNVLLTPDKKPFYAATYIPKSGRHGRPGMRELIPWISNLWENEREKIRNSSSQIIDAFKNSTKFSAGETLTEETLDEAYNQYRHQYDETYGGFGSSPKFPSPHNLMFLLRYARQYPDSDALTMVEKTLTQMRRGGIFDHIGLGFHRYSTDRKWLVTHFEKMLYDQAMLMMAYTEAWQMTGNPLFKRTVDEIAEYIFRKMQHPEGGFYSAEDADSDGEEGKFYVWSVSKIHDVLPPAKAELAIEIFNLSKEGNYEDESTGRRTGKNIPHLTKPLSELAAERDMEEEKLAELIESIRRQLLDARKNRIHPLLDDKILTDWNGLVIAALAKAGRALGNSNFIEEAKRCWVFISENMLAGDGNLKHRFRNGNVAIDAHADDYAFLVWGLTELYETTFETEILNHALSLQKYFNEHFYDTENGGYFFTSEKQEKLLGRKKQIHDGALPSSNSVALLNLLRLGRIAGNTEWEKMVDQAHNLFADNIRKAPTGFGFSLISVDFTKNNSREIIICGKDQDLNTQKMLEQLSRHFLPNSVIILKNPEDQEIERIAPYLSNYEMKKNKATAYVCENYSCRQPVTSARKIIGLLEKS